jgi:hypothetical protein
VTRLFGEREGKRIYREPGKKNNKREREKKIRGKYNYENKWRKQERRKSFRYGKKGE